MDAAVKNRINKYTYQIIKAYILDETGWDDEWRAAVMAKFVLSWTQAVADKDIARLIEKGDVSEERLKKYVASLNQDSGLDYHSKVEKRRKMRAKLRQESAKRDAEGDGGK